MAQSFEEFYLNTAAAVYRYIYVRAASRQDAEDLVAEVYYRAFRSGTGTAKMTRAWIFTIASNLMKNYYRDQKPSEILPEDILSMDNVEAVVLSSERTRELVAAIGRLSEEDQTMVTLRYFAELPYKEIASVMGISVPAAKTRMSRALERLERYMREGLYT